MPISSHVVTMATIGARSRSITALVRLAGHTVRRTGTHRAHSRRLIAATTEIVGARDAVVRSSGRLGSRSHTPNRGQHRQARLCRALSSIATAWNSGRHPVASVVEASHIPATNKQKKKINKNPRSNIGMGFDQVLDTTVNNR